MTYNIEKVYKGMNNMKVEEITLKRLETEHEYLKAIFIKHFKSTYKDEEERLKIAQTIYDEVFNEVVENGDYDDYELLEGINKEIQILEIRNEVYRQLIKKHILQTDDINEVIEIDNLIMGKVVAKKAGKTGAKFGKFLGKKVKEGAIGLYNNKDEILGKAVNSIQDRQDKNDTEYERYKRRYSNFSAEQLKEIVLDESNGNIERRAAKDLYDEKL